MWLIIAKQFQCYCFILFGKGNKQFIQLKLLAIHIFQWSFLNHWIQKASIYDTDPPYLTPPSRPTITAYPVECRLKIDTSRIRCISS